MFLLLVHAHIYLFLLLFSNFLVVYAQVYEQVGLFLQV